MKTRPPFKRTLPRYTLVGLICVGLNNIILIGGDAIGLHYSVLAVICFLFVGGLAYVTHADFTFVTKRSWTGYFRFLGTQTLGLLLTIVILFVLSDQLMLSVWIAAPAVTIIMFAYQFITTRWAVGANRA